MLRVGPSEWGWTRSRDRDRDHTRIEGRRPRARHYRRRRGRRWPRAVPAAWPPRHPPRLYRLGGGSWRRGVDSVKRMTVRRVIVDHVLFVVEDLAASRRLYTAALAPLGHEELYVQEDCVSYGAEDLDDFSICPRGARDHGGSWCVLRRRSRGRRRLLRGRRREPRNNARRARRVDAWHAPDPVVDAPHGASVP